MTDRTGLLSDSADFDGPADSPGFAEAVVGALRAQGQMLGNHEQLVQTLSQSRDQLLSQLSDLTAQVSLLVNRASSTTPPAAPGTTAALHQTPAAPPRDSYAPDPAPFSGDLGCCRGFLLQCRHVFLQKPLTFSSDASKIIYVVGLLRGRALDWAHAEETRYPLRSLTYDTFEKKLKLVFDHPDHAGSAAGRLLVISQGSRSTAEYSVEFRTLAADSGWNDVALAGVFTKGLTDDVKDELACREAPANLDDLVSLAIRIDNRLRERRRERGSRSRASPGSSLSTLQPRPLSQASSTPFQPPSPPTQPPEEPMQLGRTHLTPEERQRRIRLGRCLYCGEPNHRIATCPVRPKDQARP